MISQQTILDRKKGRDKVVPITDLAKSEADTLPPEGVITYWTILRDLADGQLPPPAPRNEIKPMTDHIAACFARDTQMPYGKHQGLSIAEIAEQDPQYLLWLAEREDDFQKTVRRYVANEGVRAYLNRKTEE